MKQSAISLLLTVLFIFPVSVSRSQPRSAIDRTTDAAMLAGPAAGLIVSLVRRDYKGTVQLALSGAGTLAVTYLLKYSISKERPDHSDHRAFPSNHTALATAGATFLQKRYGWKYGVPAYVAAAYVGWGRIYARKHDIWDVTAGALIGATGAYLSTRPFGEKHRLTFSPVVYDKGKPGIYISLVF